METITKKVFSLCDDFNPDEGFEEMYDEISAETGHGCYIDYTANSKEFFETSEYDKDLIAIRLIELGAEEGEEVLISIDY